MFVTTRLRMQFAVLVGVAFTALLALAAFSATASAHQEGATTEQEDGSAKQNDAAAEEEGPITIENHAWENYHWARTTNPLNLKLGDNVSGAWEGYLDSTVSDWNESDVLNLTEVSGQTSPKRCAAKSGRVEVCNAAYGRKGWLGIAQIYLSGDHITRGTAKLNDSYSMSAAEKLHVMCQEVGHTFGLGHTSEDGSSQGTCMDYADDSTNSQHPNTHDYEQLATIYEHTDTTTTSSMSASTSRGDLNSRAEWGKLKHRDADGKHEVYERDLKNGEKLVTFVEVAVEEDQPQQKKQEKKQDK